MRRFLIQDPTSPACVEWFAGLCHAITRGVAVTAMVAVACVLLWESQRRVRMTEREDLAELLVVGASVGDPAWWTDALALGAPCDAQSGSGDTALALAAGRGDVVLVTRLIEAGADVAAMSDVGMTPLAMAAMNGRAEVIRVLIDAGAAVDQRIRNDGTALHAAAAQSHHEAAKVLIEHGAAVNARDGEGCTPLIRLAYVGEADCGFAATLIAAGADVRLRNDEGETAYEIAEVQGRRDFVAVFR